MVTLGKCGIHLSNNHLTRQERPTKPAGSARWGSEGGISVWDHPMFCWRGTCQDDGTSMFEIVIGITVLLVIFVPLVQLLISMNAVAAADTSRTTASNLASTWIDQAREDAAQAATGPDAASSLDGLPVAGSAWPNATTSSCQGPWPACTTVGTETYRIDIAGGWCQLNSNQNSNQWANTLAQNSGGPLQYFVAVKVVWGNGTSASGATGSGGGSVVQYTSVPTLPSWKALPTTTATCPVVLS